MNQNNNGGQYPLDPTISPYQQPMYPVLSPPIAAPAPFYPQQNIPPPNNGPGVIIINNNIEKKSCFGTSFDNQKKYGCIMMIVGFATSIIFAGIFGILGMVASIIFWIGLFLFINGCCMCC